MHPDSSASGGGARRLDQRLVCADGPTAFVGLSPTGCIACKLDPACLEGLPWRGSFCSRHWAWIMRPSWKINPHAGCFRAKTHRRRGSRHRSQISTNILLLVYKSPTAHRLVCRLSVVWVWDVAEVRAAAYIPCPHPLVAASSLGPRLPFSTVFPFQAAWPIPESFLTADLLRPLVAFTCLVTMKFSSGLSSSLLLLYLSLASVALAQAARQSCPQIRVRREWRRLSSSSQASYIRAVKCLTTRPSRLRTRYNLRHYDDFQYIHSTLYFQIHFVARFLPWHRHFVYLYEQALNQCGFREPLPYWNWSLDFNNLIRSPVFSPNAFGGNGSGPVDPRLPDDGGAVATGPFANFQLVHPIPHLLHRTLDSYYEEAKTNIPFLGEYYSSDAIAQVKSQTDFLSFSHDLEGRNPMLFPNTAVSPHAAIHMVIGGDMASSVYAANELPWLIHMHSLRFSSLADLYGIYRLFFAHHGNIDKIWTDWQAEDQAARRIAYHGNAVRGEQDDNASLNDRMPFLNYDGTNPTVREVMNTTAYPYCYTYE
ncbi:hypothetical protein O181_071830 [Austropuccinia psidii MF-1]|uniref:Tyrosinase copper-binding domain-containing protein n=1 Tax=Austropuccinia psidii MF-1 TaxID=1389203 RepID=A0A9Q3F7G7_9BASI|nr:hypothetical protein [Austropuccinia psidii MF-1]